MSQNEVTLEVQEAYTRDIGRKVARIDYDSMDTLNASTGDVIKIKGKRRTVAQCLPLYPADEGKGMVRFDGFIRNNAGVTFGDSITVKKIKAVAAEKIVVVPLEAIPPIDERYLADALESVPLIKGDNFMVPYFGGGLSFQIIGVTPNADAVIGTQKTVFHITEKAEEEERSISPYEKIHKALEQIRIEEATLGSKTEQVSEEPQISSEEPQISSEDPEDKRIETLENVIRDIKVILNEFLKSQGK